jgi:Salmonella virulence plasmid 65kDa B protein/Insecticide toxin TcdB middle/C-terminal region
MLLRPPTGRTLGTGSLTVPIAVSPGRSGFGPQLTLTYDSGSGNGAFGFGWSLSIPSITRKTDKGLPKYQDALETDVFILSGAEDLVPVLVDGCSQRHSTSRTLSDGSCWTIERYRPRVEGLFARIERWTNRGNGEVHWRSITRDNVATLYGKTDNARIADPAYPKRVFSWLICESYDDKGNAIVYDYKREDSQGLDPRLAHERNRTKESRSANYLKHIKYGNRVSRLVQPDLSQNEWMFEVVFDYGEHDPDDPKPRDTNEWLCRHDPFSSYRAGAFVATLLPDTVLPPNLHPDEQREAARALRGSILRQEIYGLDGTDKERHPYSVSERDYELTLLQPRGTNRHAVFFVHPRETIDYGAPYHGER